MMEDAQSHLGWFVNNISDRSRWIAAFKNSEFLNATDRTKHIDINAEDVVVGYFPVGPAHDCWPAVRRAQSFIIEILGTLRKINQRGDEQGTKAARKAVFTLESPRTAGERKPVSGVSRGAAAPLRNALPRRNEVVSVV
jgi:hypothetical protein